MNIWIMLSISLGFTLKFILWFIMMMTHPSPLAISSETSIKTYLFILIPWGTYIIFYAIPFIFSPWIGK